LIIIGQKKRVIYMKTYLLEFFLEWENILTRAVEKTPFLSSIIFSEIRTI
jgi:hypothetical protein